MEATTKWMNALQQLFQIEREKEGKTSVREEGKS